MLMAILQAVGAAWYHCQDDAMKTCKISSLVLLIGYYVLLIPLAWLQYFWFNESSWIGIIVFWVWFICIVLASALVAKFGSSKLDLKTWYNDIFFSGIRPICWHMMKLSEGGWGKVSGFIFELWFCFSIKYVFPWAMYTLLIMTIKADIDEPYGEYHDGWQAIGALIPVICFIVFLC